MVLIQRSAIKEESLAGFASTQAFLAFEHKHYIFNSYNPFNIAG